MNPRLDVEMSQALQRYLGEQLPSYMIPSTFVFVDSLPRTPSGKIDRLGLSAISHTALPDTFTEPPQGDLEVALANIWGEVLGIENVGRRETFLGLGGYSLLAIQANILVFERFGVSLPPQSFLEGTTIEEVADRLSRLLSETHN
jgi:hypothetical protein